MNNFDKILLYHPQGNMSYIRKLTMSYGYYTVLATVNEINRVEFIGIDNTFQIIPFNKLNREDKDLLGREKCSKMLDNDLLNIYKINKAIKLSSPYKLHKPCINMRYTTVEETIELKRLLLENIENVFVVENKVYDGSYVDESILDLSKITDTIKDSLAEVKLEHYDSIGAKGQTRLM